MFSAWCGDCCSPFWSPARFELGDAAPTFSSSSDHLTVIPLVKLEWQIVGEPFDDRPQLPPAIHAAHNFALSERFDCHASAPR